MEMVTALLAAGANTTEGRGAAKAQNCDCGRLASWLRLNGNQAEDAAWGHRRERAEACKGGGWGKNKMAPLSRAGCAAALGEGAAKETARGSCCEARGVTRDSDALARNSRLSSYLQPRISNYRLSPWPILTDWMSDMLAPRSERAP